MKKLIPFLVIFLILGVAAATAIVRADEIGYGYGYGYGGPAVQTTATATPTQTPTQTATATVAPVGMSGDMAAVFNTNLGQPVTEVSIPKAKGADMWTILLGYVVKFLIVLAIGVVLFLIIGFYTAVKFMTHPRD